MTTIHQKKRLNRARRHARIRAKISGTTVRPRVAVFRSSQHILAQAVDDTLHVTIASVSDRALKKGTKTEKALAIGKELAGLLKAKHVDAVVFDVGGFKYHGRVKAVAEGLREAGITV